VCIQEAETIKVMIINMFAAWEIAKPDTENMYNRLKLGGGQLTRLPL
jgi:hypothetical protein